MRSEKLITVLSPQVRGRPWENHCTEDWRDTQMNTRSHGLPEQRSQAEIAVGTSAGVGKSYLKLKNCGSLRVNFNS